MNASRSGLSRLTLPAGGFFGSCWASQFAAAARTVAGCGAAGWADAPPPPPDGFLEPPEPPPPEPNWPRFLGCPRLCLDSSKRPAFITSGRRNGPLVIISRKHFSSQSGDLIAAASRRAAACRRRCSRASLAWPRIFRKWPWFSSVIFFVSASSASSNSSSTFNAPFAAVVMSLRVVIRSDSGAVGS